MSDPVARIPRQTSGWLPAWIALIVAAAVCVTFWPCTQSALRREAAPSAQSTYPLAAASLAMELRLWGPAPRGCHVVSVLLHVLNTLLVFAVAARLARWTNPAAPACSYVAAGVAALLFGLHPMRVEGVAWTAQRGVQLSALFALLAVLLHVWAGKKGRLWLATCGCFALSLASGPYAIGLPLLLLVLDGYPLRRFARGLLRIGLEKLPLFVLAGYALVLLPARPAAPLAYAGQVAFGAVFYFWKTVWPWHLLPIYELPWASNPLAGPYVAAWVMVVAAAIVAIVIARRLPGVSVALACYLLVMLGLGLAGAAEVADRHSFLPGVALFVALGVALASLWNAVQPACRSFAMPLAVLGVLLAGGLGLLSWRQCTAWQTPRSLWEYAIANEPKQGPFSAAARCNLADELCHDGEHVRAVQLYRAALSFQPSYMRAQRGLARALVDLNEPAMAVEAYDRLLKSAPRDAELQFEFACALAMAGYLEDAEQYLRAAVALDPTRATFPAALGRLLILRERWDDAVAGLRAAAERWPGDAELWYDLGRAFRGAGHISAARDAFRAALQYDPGHTPARAALESLSPARTPS